MNTHTPRNPRRGTRGKKQPYRVRNWHAYDQALVQRGSLSVWLSPEALTGWRAEPTHRQGARPVCADDAVRTVLALRSVFRLPLRAAEGFVRSVFARSGTALPVPGATTLFRGGRGLPVLLAKRKTAPEGDEPLVLVVDSTGVKLYGEGEWKVRQHGKAKRRKWKKIHIAVDEKGEIKAVDVTDNDTHDASVAPKLVARVNSPIAAFLGEGAYDREPVYGACAQRGSRVLSCLPGRTRRSRSTGMPRGRRTRETRPCA